MLRKRIAAFMALLLVCLNLLSVRNNVGAEENTLSGQLGESITWTLDLINQKLEISGTGSLESYNLMQTIGIGACLQVKEIVVGEGITKLGTFNIKNDNNYQTSFTALEKVTIPSTVTIIPGGAFFGCTSLKEVVINGDVTQIGDYAFSRTAVEKFDFPNNLEYIGKYAFYDCTSLKEAVLPDSLVKIGSGVFQSCSSLENLKLPAALDLKNITSVDFSGCDSLFDNNGCIVINGVLFAVDKDNYTNVFKVSDGVKTITSFAFSSTKFEKIVLPDGLEKIESSAFSSKTDLREINIPNTVTYIGASAFSGCTSLKNITIPESVTYIGNYAFSNTALESIVIPKNVEYLGTSVLYRCKNLTSAKFLMSQDTCHIGLDILEGCTALDDGNGNAVVDGVMYGCLTKGVYITADVEKILVDLKNKDIQFDPDQKNFIYDGESIYSKDGKTLVFAAVGSNSKDNFTVRNGCEKIQYGAISKCTYDCSLTIPNSVTNIYYGDDCYVGSSVIKSVEGSYARQYAERYGYDFEAIKMYTSCGDANGNGVIDLDDVLIVLSVALGITDLVGVSSSAVDTNGDGNVDLTDTLEILKASLGVVTLDKVEQTASGDTYEFPKEENVEDVEIELDKSMSWSPYNNPLHSGGGAFTRDKSMSPIVLLTIMTLAAGAVITMYRKRKYI